MYSPHLKPQKLSPFKTSKISPHNRQHSRSPSRSNSANRSLNTSYSHNRSLQSQHLWHMIEDTQIFPNLCIQMLKCEQKNIGEMKKKINRQKNRVNSQMQSLKVQLEHIIQDFRLSILAILDGIYKEYILKYSQLKSQIMDINRLKQQIEVQFGSNKQKQISRVNNNFSNLYTIKSIEENKLQLKRFHIINYIAQMQKEKIAPLNDVAEYLHVINQYQNGFFQPDQFMAIMKDIKGQFRANFRKILEEAYRFIREPQNIAFKEIGRNRDANTTVYPDNIQAQRDTPTLNQHINVQPTGSQPYQQFPRDSSNIRRADNFEVSQNYYPVISEREREVFRDPSVQINAPRIPITINQITRPEQQRGPQSRSQPYFVFQEQDSQIQQMHTDYSHRNFQQQKPHIPALSFQRDPSLSQPRSISQQNRENPLTSPAPLSSNSLRHSSQTLLSPHRISLDAIKISQTGSFKSKAMDVVLCSLNISQQIIAVGSRDGSIFLYNRNGNIIKGYENVHKSPVCALSLVAEGRFFVSGSDHPCPQIIVWEINSASIQIYCKFKEHKGAVTAIQCLNDNQHIISGSYDKRVLIYSLHQQKPAFNLPSSKHSITSLALNSTATKLISCSLQNNSLNIWQIVRSQTGTNRSINNFQNKGRVETIFLEQVIENNTMICSLVSSGIKQNIVYIGTKDGRVKIVDIYKGEAVKNMSCSAGNAIIQMLVVEGYGDNEDGRDAKGLVLCWPCKERCFKIIDCQSGKVSNVTTKGYVEFGCGVGPKATAFKDGSGFVVCSQGQDRQIYSYKVNRVL